MDGSAHRLNKWFSPTGRDPNHCRERVLWRNR